MAAAGGASAGITAMATGITAAVTAVLITAVAVGTPGTVALRIGRSKTASASLTVATDVFLEGHRVRTNRVNWVRFAKIIDVM
jgi:hypothetical protein